MAALSALLHQSRHGVIFRKFGWRKRFQLALGPEAGSVAVCGSLPQRLTRTFIRAPFVTLSRNLRRLIRLYRGRGSALAVPTIGHCRQRGRP